MWLPAPRRLQGSRTQVRALLGRALAREELLSGGAELDDDAPVEIEIGDALDLHGFAPRDVPRVVKAYLDAALERGLDEVRLIHGKGRGVQRARVSRVLAAHPRVREFFDGSPERGAWGATIVRLRH